MPFLLSLTAISHILYCCASVGSYERSGGPRTGWGPHSFPEWYSGTPITINELAPVQSTGHTGLLVHLRSVNPCGFDSPGPTTQPHTGSSRHSYFLKAEYCRKQLSEKMLFSITWEAESLQRVATWEDLARNQQALKSQIKSKEQKVPLPLFYACAFEPLSHDASKPCLLSKAMAFSAAEELAETACPLPTRLISALVLTAFSPGSWTHDQPPDMNN